MVTSTGQLASRRRNTWTFSLSTQHSRSSGLTSVPIGFRPEPGPGSHEIALELPAVDQREAVQRPAAELESHLCQSEFLPAGRFVASQFDEFFFR